MNELERDGSCKPSDSESLCREGSAVNDWSDDTICRGWQRRRVLRNPNGVH